MQILTEVKFTELLSLLVSVVSAVIALVALVRTRRLAAMQLELQRRQAAAAAESANWARVQREQNQAANDFPRVTTNVLALEEHYQDGTLHDTALQMTIENPSTRTRSLPDVTIGFLEDPSDFAPKFGSQARYQDKLATFPIEVSANSSVVLYSYCRHLKMAFERHYGPNDPGPKTLVVFARVAGMPQPLGQVAGVFSLGAGLSGTTSK